MKTSTRPASSSRSRVAGGLMLTSFACFSACRHHRFHEGAGLHRHLHAGLVDVGPAAHRAVAAVVTA
jgi:hypothetical protein